MIDAACRSKSLEENEQTLEFGALVQMGTLGLMLIGAAIVLLGSILNPRQADPMGIFGLRSVMRDCMPSDEGEQAGHWPDLNSAA